MSMTAQPPVVSCDPEKGCRPFGEHVAHQEEREKDTEKRLTAVEDEQKVIHNRITDGLKDKIIEQRGFITLLIIQLISVALTIFSLVKK